jgi:hypothetical protein
MLSTLLNITSEHRVILKLLILRFTLVEVTLSSGIVVFTVNPGVGLTLWFTENIGLSFETSYKSV